MASRTFDEYIGQCLSLSKTEFLERNLTPMLVGQVANKEFFFSRQYTQVTGPTENSPLTRELFVKGRSYPVFELRQRLAGPQAQVRVGRTEENDLVLSDKTVSSRHAVFKKNHETGSFSVQDLASMNGTLVNGSRLVVGKALALFDGDVVAFGDSVFVFFYPSGLYDIVQSDLGCR